MNRRQFLLGLSQYLAALAIPVGWPNAPSLAMPVAHKKYNLESIKIFSQGREGYDPATILSEKSLPKPSIATRLDIKNGTITQNIIPIENAHYMAMNEGDENIFLLSQFRLESALLSPDLKTLATFKAPEGYQFSGHGISLPDGKYFVVGLREISPVLANQIGKLGIYNTSTLKLEKMYNTGGYAPHDMIINAEKTHLILSHYGGEVPCENYEKIPQTSSCQSEKTINAGKITIIRLSDFKIEKHIYSPKGISPIHIESSRNGKVYAVSNAVVKGDEPSYERHWLETKFNWYHCKALPIVEYDLMSEDTREITTELLKQRRSQSISYNAYTRKTVATFVFTNSIVVIDEIGNPKRYDTSQYKIEAPTGVIGIPETPLIALCGVYDDLSIIDLDTMELVQTFKVKLHRNSHLNVTTIF